MDLPHNPTQPRGSDGRFGTVPAPVADVSLDADDFDESAEGREHMGARTSNGTDLDAYVSHPDAEIRMATTANPHLTGDHIRRLATDPDWQVRHCVARLPYGGVGELVSGDPSPIVRSAALDRADLPPSDRDRLTRADPVVARIRGELTNWGLATAG